MATPAMPTVITTRWGWLCSQLLPPNSGWSRDWGIWGIFPSLGQHPALPNLAEHFQGCSLDLLRFSILIFLGLVVSLEALLVWHWWEVLVPLVQ